MCLRLTYTHVSSRFFRVVSLPEIVFDSVLFIHTSTQIVLAQWMEKWKQLFLLSDFFLFFHFILTCLCRDTNFLRVTCERFIMRSFSSVTHTLSFRFCFAMDIHCNSHHVQSIELEKKIARQINMLLAKRVTPIIIYGNYKASLLVYFNVITFCGVQKRKVLEIIIYLCCCCNFYFVVRKRDTF